MDMSTPNMMNVPYRMYFARFDNATQVLGDTNGEDLIPALVTYYQRRQESQNRLVQFTAFVRAITTYASFNGYTTSFNNSGDSFFLEMWAPVHVGGEINQISREMGGGPEWVPGPDVVNVPNIQGDSGWMDDSGFGGLEDFTADNVLDFLDHQIPEEVPPSMFTTLREIERRPSPVAIPRLTPLPPARRRRPAPATPSSPLPPRKRKARSSTPRARTTTTTTKRETAHPQFGGTYPVGYHPTVGGKDDEEEDDEE